MIFVPVSFNDFSKYRILIRIGVSSESISEIYLMTEYGVCQRDSSVVARRDLRRLRCFSILSLEEVEKVEGIYFNLGIKSFQVHSII